MRWRAIAGVYSRPTSCFIILGLTIAALTASDCRMWGSDEPWKTQAKDLAFTPRDIVVPLVTTSNEDAGAPFSGQRTVSIHGLNPSDDKFAEGYHVDVCLGWDCTCGSQQSLGLDLPRYLSLVATASSGSSAACTQLSQESLHCVLATNGTAQFAVAAANTPLIAVPLYAWSGDCSHQAPRGEVYVGNPLPDGAKLVLSPNPITVEPSPSQRACGSTTACSDSRLIRASPVTVQLTGAGANPLPVDISASLGGTSAGAWLAASSTECTSGNPGRPAILVRTAESGSATFVVCADGTAGEYELHVGASQPAVAVSQPVVTTVPVNVTSEAANVTASPAQSNSCPAGQQGNVVLRFTDCNGAAVVTTATVALADGSSIDVTSDSSGKACVAEPTDGGLGSISVSTCSLPVPVSQP